MSNFDLAEAIVEFAAGTEANWNNFTLPIPANVVIFTTDTMRFKKGDGNRRFSELSDGPSISGIVAGEDNLVNVLTTLVPADNDGIIIIDSEIYKASPTKLTSIVSRLSAIANSDAIQNANMDTIDSQFSMASTSISSADNGKMIITGGHKMIPGLIPTGIVVPVEVSPINLRSVGVYSDRACTIPVTAFNYSSTYWCKVTAFHDTIDTDDLSFALTETNAYVTTEHMGRGLFKIVVAKPPTADPLVLTATVSYNADSVSVNKAIAMNSYNPIVAAVYGGYNTDYFRAVTVDIFGNIICAGYTTSESASSDALVTKFDSNLNLLARKRYGGTGADYFYGVTTDSSDNIICAGSTASEGSGGDALVVKFDSNLNILARKRYGGTGADYFYGVTTDSSDNIICAGSTASEGSGGDALVVKFDANLNIVSRKRYGGGSSDYFYAVATDSSGNIICAGYTLSEGTGGNDALVVKLDTNLNILARKRYGGSSSEQFQAVTTDSSDNIICAGVTASEGAGEYDALVVTFDGNLNIVARKRYGGGRGDYFNTVVTDSSDNIICAGNTSSEGVNSAEALVVKFDTSLNILARKRYGGNGSDYFWSVDTDSANNIICAGYASSEGAGEYDALVVKFPAELPSGTFTGTVLTELFLADSALTLADSALTLADSTLTLADSTLTLVDSTLTLADSTLTLEKDVIDV